VFGLYPFVSVEDQEIVVPAVLLDGLEKQIGGRFAFLQKPPAWKCPGILRNSIDGREEG